LRDHAGRSRRDRDLRSRRDLNRLDVAASAKFGVLVHISLRCYLNCRRLGCRCKLFARVANDSGERARLACAPQKWKSKLRGLFQQLDHALQQAPRAAAIKAAMIETERNLRLRYWNEF